MRDGVRKQWVMRAIYKPILSGHDITLLDECLITDVIDCEASGSSAGRRGLRVLFEPILARSPDWRERGQGPDRGGRSSGGARDVVRDSQTIAPAHWRISLVFGPSVSCAPSMVRRPSTGCD